MPQHSLQCKQKSWTVYVNNNHKKVKWSRYRPGVAQRVGRGIALLFHDSGTTRGWVVSSTPRPHFIPGKDPVPILQEAGWATGPVWTGGKSRPHRDSIPDRPARSHSLYRLSYPTHNNHEICIYYVYNKYMTVWNKLLSFFSRRFKSTCFWISAFVSYQFTSLHTITPDNRECSIDKHINMRGWLSCLASCRTLIDDAAFFIRQYHNHQSVILIRLEDSGFDPNAGQVF